MKIFDMKAMQTRFQRDEDGATMVWNIFWTVIFLLFAGLAMDTSNAHRMRMILQVTADSSAIAATMSADESKNYQEFMGAAPTGLTARERGTAVALEMARKNMGGAQNGNVLLSSDVDFGSWSSAGGFVEDSVGEFVRVTTRRSSANANGLDTFFLGMFNGLPSWDIAAQAVAGPDPSPCITDGIVTAEKIDFQSNNTYSKAICLHGNQGIEVNQNNTYEEGVVVSMPNPAMLTVPDGDLSQNPGLEESLQYYNQTPKLAYKVDEMREGFQDLSSEWQPDYVANNPLAQIFDFTASAFNPDLMEPGNVYRVTCGSTGNGTLTLRGSSLITAQLGYDGITGIEFVAQPVDGGKTTTQTLIKNVVIVTDCEIRLDAGTVIEDAIIATSSTDPKSIQGSAGVSVGRPDSCTPGGGAQLVSNGGMHFAAKMEFHGSQIIAAGAVTFAAQVDGIGGTSVQALGRVELASNNDLALCETGPDVVLEVKTYKMVQ